MLDTGSFIQGKDVVYFLRKQMWVLILTFLAVSGSTLFYSLGLPDLYVATTKIAITPQFLQQVLPAQMVSYESFYLTNLTFETELQIMRSEPLSRRIAWVLADEPRADDARMLELLAPWAGMRFRVVHQLWASGITAPRFGPRIRGQRPR